MDSPKLWITIGVVLVTIALAMNPAAMFKKTLKRPMPNLITSTR